MKFIMIIVALAALSSCSLVESVKATAARTKELAGEVQAVVAVAKDTLVEAKATYASAKAEADTDKDGKTSGDEWLTYLLLGGGGLGGLGALAKGAVRNAKSDGRKDRLEDRLAAIESRNPYANPPT